MNAGLKTGTILELVKCLGGSKNSGIPERMVYHGKPYQMDDFWGTIVFGNIHISQL